MLSEAAESRVIYAELRLNLARWLDAGLTPEEIVTAINEGRRAAVEGLGIESNIIVCVRRDFSSGTDGNHHRRV